jgi:hypothetical protein
VLKSAYNQGNIQTKPKDTMHFKHIFLLGWVLEKNSAGINLLKLEMCP